MSPGCWQILILYGTPPAQQHGSGSLFWDWKDVHCDFPELRRRKMWITPEKKYKLHKLQYPACDQLYAGFRSVVGQMHTLQQARLPPTWLCRAVSVPQLGQVPSWEKPQELATLIACPERFWWADIATSETLIKTISLLSIFRCLLASLPKVDIM